MPVRGQGPPRQPASGRAPGWRQQVFHRADKLRSQVMKGHARRHRQEDHFGRRPNQGRGVHDHIGACVKLGQVRRHHHSQDGRTHGHQDRKRQVGAGEKGHHIGRRAPGATGHQDQSQGKLPRQPHGARHGPAHKGHDEELRRHARGDGFGHAKRPAKVVDRQGDAHAQHDNPQAPDDFRPIKPSEPRRPNQGQRRRNQNPNRKQVRRQLQDTFHHGASTRPEAFFQGETRLGGARFSGGNRV